MKRMTGPHINGIQRTAKQPGVKAWIGVIVLILLTAQWSPQAEASSKMTELNQKVADINLLRQQLLDRCDQVKSIQGALISQKEGYVAEIKLLTKSLQIATFDVAVQQSRIRYNLELLRIINAFLDELDIKYLFYQNGLDKLQYLNQLATDDMKMISALRDLKIEALVTQISIVINRYLPEAHIIQIAMDNIVQPTAKSIWEEITARK